MKRVWIYLLVLLIVLGIPLTAAAQELTGCTVAAESVAAAPGAVVTVPVYISDNPGFTNFGIALDYDREQLSLQEIVLVDEEGTYLCSETSSANPAWADGDGTEYGYVTTASADKITGDGILFSVRFRVSESFSGSAAVTPKILYMRNNTAVLPVFEDVAVTAKAGTVTRLVPGDYDGNGKITLNDVNALIDVYRSKTPLSEDLMNAVDLNGDGKITLNDVNGLIDIYRNKSWMSN